MPWTRTLSLRREYDIKRVLHDHGVAVAEPIAFCQYPEAIMMAAVDQMLEEAALSAPATDRERQLVVLLTRRLYRQVDLIAPDMRDIRDFRVQPSTGRCCRRHSDDVRAQPDFCPAHSYHRAHGEKVGDCRIT